MSKIIRQADFRDAARGSSKEESSVKGVNLWRSERTDAESDGSAESSQRVFRS